MPRFILFARDEAVITAVHYVTKSIGHDCIFPEESHDMIASDDNVAIFDARLGYDAYKDVRSVYKTIVIVNTDLHGPVYVDGFSIYRVKGCFPGDKQQMEYFTLCLQHASQRQEMKTVTTRVDDNLRELSKLSSVGA